MGNVQVLKKKRLGLIALVAFFLLLLVGIVGWIWVSQQSSPEEKAIGFYKAAWVEGDAKKAVSFGSSEGGAEQKLEGYVSKGQNTPVMMAEYQDSGDSYRMYYIYRPADSKMFAVQITQYMGQWVVTQYDRQDNYSLQMVNQALPQLQGQWKEIQKP